jgi:hypothetical protein
VDEVINNCLTWNAKYAIVYQETGSKLEEKWGEVFELVSEFDWSTHMHLFRGVELWSRDKPTPKWFLLRYGKDVVIA